jgi:low affinity Fe/Cu permease
MHDSLYPAIRTPGTQAIQAKLDELLRSQGDARTSLTGLDDQEPEQIEAHRARAKARD